MARRPDQPDAGGFVATEATHHRRPETVTERLDDARMRRLRSKRKLSQAWRKPPGKV